MIQHGDDIYKYPNIWLNFSSNVFNHFCHEGLYSHLASRMSSVCSYPAPLANPLQQQLAARLGIKEGEITVTNGATEAIYLVAHAFSGAVSAIAYPTFSEYEQGCNIYGHTVVPFDEAHLSDYDVVWLCNPNNPTGKVMDKSVLIQLITSAPHVIFVIDQSYHSFSPVPMLSAEECVAFPNVILLYSMTKDFAIPGLRLGYVTACQTLIERLSELRMPWSVNSLAIEAGMYLLGHSDAYRLDVEQLISERKRVAEAFLSIGGIDVYESDTHILLCKLQQGSAAELKEYLALQKGILIRDASNFTGLDQSHFRIAVQSPAENNELINAITQYLHDTVD